MAQQLKLIARVMGALMVMAVCTAVVLDAAPKKGKAAAAKKKAPAKTAAISRDRVIREFNAVYQNPPGSKKVKVTYIGNVRRYTETRGAQDVPAQAHKIALTVQLTDCGITMRDIWEVYFYKLETEWIFLDIMQVASTQLTKTKKKHPSLDDTSAKKLISEALMHDHEGLKVQEVTIQGKKSGWRLCTPEYQVTSKITATLTNDIYNMVTGYECLIISTIAYTNGKWEHMKTSCMYRGKEVADCHIGTMCRELSTGSTIPPLQDEDAFALLKHAFESEYGLKKNNITIEHLSIIKKDPVENFGKTFPYTLTARFLIDEQKELPATAESLRRTVPVRAVYECIVRAHTRYSLINKKWEGIIDTCCLSEAEQCGYPCSNPDKGCRRLGEK